MQGATSQKLSQLNQHVKRSQVNQNVKRGKVSPTGPMQLRILPDSQACNKDSQEEQLARGWKGCTMCLAFMAGDDMPYLKPRVLKVPAASAAGQEAVCYMTLLSLIMATLKDGHKLVPQVKSAKPCSLDSLVPDYCNLIGLN